MKLERPDQKLLIFRQHSIFVNSTLPAKNWLYKKIFVNFKLNFGPITTFFEFDGCFFVHDHNTTLAKMP